MKKAKIMSAFLSLALGITSVGSLRAFAVANADAPKGIPIGAVFLEIDSDKTVYLKGDNVSGDGTYDISWDIKDIAEFNDAGRVRLFFKNIEPFDFGNYKNVNLNVDELWLDGVKSNIQSEFTPSYQHAKDDYHDGNVLDMWFNLKNINQDGVNANETVRVVFTLSGLDEPVTEEGLILGDVNDDSSVNAIDASYVLSHYASISTGKKGSLDNAHSKAADFNKDGSLNAADASEILYYYSKISLLNGEEILNDRISWERSKLTDTITEVPSSYFPLDISKIAAETDLAFSGTVLDIEEYTVHAMTADGFIHGPFKADVLEVKVNEVYAGETDKEILKIYYPSSVSFHYSNSIQISKYNEYIFFASAFDDDFYENEQISPDARFDQEKYADMYITSTHSKVMPVKNGIVSINKEYFADNENTLSKALDKQGIIDSIPSETKETDAFLFYKSEDIVDLLKEIFDR